MSRITGTALFFCFFSAGADFSSYYAKIPYESCTCLNHQYTRQLTAPYEAEIEQWIEQTSRPPGGAACEPDFTRRVCLKNPSSLAEASGEGVWWFFGREGAEDEDADEATTGTWSQWLWGPDGGQGGEEVKKPSFIPSVCFYASARMTGRLPRSQNEYFSCIHNHYSGSSHFPPMCFETHSQDTSYPKKCSALPVPCADVQNPHLTCGKKFHNRLARFKGERKCNKGSAHPRKPCLNKEYIALTARAFHDVARCLRVPLELAFAIFHHESRFLINSRSYTGALCYGQVTGAAAADFNSFLESEPYYTGMEDLQPQNIQSRCPGVYEHFQKITTRYSPYIKRFEIPYTYDKCRLVLNPYTCFFYGLSYIRILMYKARQALNTMNNIEVAQWREQVFIFWGEGEKHKVRQNLGVWLPTEKIKIFRDEEGLFKWLVTVGYNSGLTLYGRFFTEFITHLKKTLSDPQNRELRHQLIYTGLKTSFFTESFSSFILEHYPRRRRRRQEVASYMGKVAQDMQLLNQSLHKNHPSLFPGDICPF